MKRVRRPHGLLPKVPEKRSRIIVVCHDGIVQANVRKASGGHDIQWRGSVLLAASNVHRRRVSGRVRRRDEGLTWARGWDTPEADALRAAKALS